MLIVTNTLVRIVRAEKSVDAASGEVWVRIEIHVRREGESWHSKEFRLSGDELQGVVEGLGLGVR